MTMGDIRVCVVGTGRAGMVHARNLQFEVPGARVVAVVDGSEEARLKAARELGVDDHFPTLPEALERVGIDAVCIATPTFTHLELVRTAAAAGKHVFCEKPISITIDEALEMIRATAKAGVVFQIGFMRRFDEGFLAAKRLIEEGAIGDPLIIRSTTRGPGLPPAWAWDTAKSNGMLAEVNSHDFDTLRWLTASEYVRVFARVKARKAEEPRRLHADFYDVATVSAELEDGTLGTIEGACPVDYGYDSRVEILGSDGMLTVGDFAQHTVIRVSKDGDVLRQTYASWRDRFRAAYRQEIAEFVDAIRTGREPRVTGVDGLRALEAVLAAIRSITSGKAETVQRHAV